MPLGGLQHYTIEPQDLERTKDFYVDVLGLENGDRPPLNFPGYWLYSGGQATVHLMGTREPREAMGRGDLKFLAAIGAFLGWRAVLCSIFAGSLAGSLVGLTSLLLGRREWSAKIPFGPYLAMGALIWMFVGTRCLDWYAGLLAP